jgi:hypothetical protein
MFCGRPAPDSTSRVPCRTRTGVTRAATAWLSHSALPAGLTQRVFWSRISRDAGWQPDWRLASREQNYEASRAAMEKRDLRPLREMSDAMTTAAVPQKRAAAMALVAGLALFVPGVETTRAMPGPPASRPGEPPASEPRRGTER